MSEDDGDRQVIHEDPAEQQGFTWVPKAVAHDPTISIPARLLYTILKGYASDDRDDFPGQEGLGKLLGRSTRQVRTLLSELVDKGLIRIERRGLGLTNRIWVA